MHSRLGERFEHVCFEGGRDSSKAINFDLNHGFMFKTPLKYKIINFKHNQLKEMW